MSSAYIFAGMCFCLCLLSVTIKRRLLCYNLHFIKRDKNRSSVTNYQLGTQQPTTGNRFRRRNIQHICAIQIHPVSRDFYQ